MTKELFTFFLVASLCAAAVAQYGDLPTVSLCYCVAEISKTGGVGLESEHGVFCWSGVGLRFLLICWSRSLVPNYKIGTKNDARVKYVILT